ncbi:uncharacterized protein V1516DRAFT_706630 [Lipomyces oligophaga]|uniref:uncharacterized protein n=1 Tax=Lipomyces oligophaga TaxID=45792 RepID=UPI0034D00C07
MSAATQFAQVALADPAHTQQAATSPTPAPVVQSSDSSTAVSGDLKSSKHDVESADSELHPSLPPEPPIRTPAYSAAASIVSTPMYPDDFDSGSAYFAQASPEESYLAPRAASTSIPAYIDTHDGWGDSNAYAANDYLVANESTDVGSPYGDMDAGGDVDSNHDVHQTEESNNPHDTAPPQLSSANGHTSMATMTSITSTAVPVTKSVPADSLFGDDDHIAPDPDEETPSNTESDPRTSFETRPSTESPSTVTAVSSTSSISHSSVNGSSLAPAQAYHSAPHVRTLQQSSKSHNLYDPQSYYGRESSQPSMYYSQSQAYPNQPQQYQQPIYPQQSSQGGIPSQNLAPPTEPILRARVTGMERSGKKAPLIKFDVYTNLPRYRTTQFRDIRRTHGEFLKLFKHLCIANPECLTTSAGAGTDEDEYRIKANFQKWLDRIMMNRVLMRDEEIMYFIEADFGYTPITKAKAPATGLRRKALKQLAPPPDDCEELVRFRPIAKQFFLETGKVHDKLQRISKVRRSLGLAEIELGHKFTNLTALEFQSGMINMWKKLGKIVMGVGDIEGAHSIAEMATLGDSLAWLSNDAYVIKETLTNRQMLIRELIAAQTTSRNRHATAARLRSSATINPLRVDEALTSLEEAKQIEAGLTAKSNRVTSNLIVEKRNWYENTEHDLLFDIADYARRVIDCERRTLSAWESIRVDIRVADGTGGLSRLGRSDLPVISRRSDLVNSQGPGGDSWSGDRRAAHGNGFEPSGDEGLDGEGVSEVDAKNAAALLANMSL